MQVTPLWIGVSSGTPTVLVVLFLDLMLFFPKRDFAGHRLTIGAVHYRLEEEEIYPGKKL